MLYSLQASRGVAAVAVMLFHLGGAFSSEKYFDRPEFIRIFSFGNTGVEFFFVLSGFIIARAHGSDIGKRNELWHYAAKRISRIYPIYWITFAIAFSGATYVQSSGVRLPSSFADYLSAILLLPPTFYQTSETKPVVLAVAWTLQYEVLFYILFGLSIYSRSLCKLLLLTWIILFSCKAFLDYPLIPILNFATTPYSVLFLAGVAVSHLTGKSNSVTREGRLILTTSTLLLITLIVSEIADFQLRHSLRTYVWGTCYAGTIFGLVTTESADHRFYRNRLLQLAGSSSYSLYLIHYPLVSVICKALILLLPNDVSQPLLWLSFAASATIICVCGYAFHVLVEIPVTKLTKRGMLGL